MTKQEEILSELIADCASKLDSIRDMCCDESEKNVRYSDILERLEEAQDFELHGYFAGNYEMFKKLVRMKEELAKYGTLENRNYAKAIVRGV